MYSTLYTVYSACAHLSYVVVLQESDLDKLAEEEEEVDFAEFTKIVDRCFFCNTVNTESFKFKEIE